MYFAKKHIISPIYRSLPINVSYENSVMELFFSSTKREELYHTKYRSENNFRAAVNNNMLFYKTKRPNIKMKYKALEQVETDYH